MQLTQCFMIIPAIFSDVNECEIRNGGCSHGCYNTVGSFECTCPQDGNPCSTQKTDLFFIVDSSSSIGADNFDVVLSFVMSTVESNAATTSGGLGPNGLQVGHLCRKI